MDTVELTDASDGTPKSMEGKGVSKAGGMVWESRRGDTGARKSKGQEEVACGLFRTPFVDGEGPFQVGCKERTCLLPAAGRVICQLLP